MNDDYGKQVGSAIHAVSLLFSDISRLFVEMHSDEFRGYKSVFGTPCTRGVSADFKKPNWMPKAVYRYYRTPDPFVIEGVTVVFLSASSILDEPIFLTFRLRYRGASSGKPKACDEWDAYKVYLNANDCLPNGEEFVQEFEPDHRLESAKMIAVPVYSIRNRDNVRNLINQLRKSPSD